MKWLLDSDPAIRWQAMRDLADESDEAVAIERSRVATEGWGARLLALQSPRGYWSRLMIRAGGPAFEFPGGRLFVLLEGSEHLTRVELTV